MTLQFLQGDTSGLLFTENQARDWGWHKADMGSILIDKDCSTAGCWTLRAEVHWPVTLSRLSQESRSLNQPMGMQQAWDQATKAVSQTRSGSAKSMNSHRHSCKAKPRTRGKRLSKNKTPEQETERLLSASPSSSQQHSHTASELALSTRVWILKALWEAMQLSMSVQPECFLSIVVSLSEGEHSSGETPVQIGQWKYFATLCVCVVMNLTLLQEYEQSYTIFFRVRIFFLLLF